MVQGNVTLSSNEMDILGIDLSNINLDVSFDEDDSKFIIHVRLLGWHN